MVTLPDTPSGDCDVVSFRLWGQPFMAISAGPAFRFNNEAISFMVYCDSQQDIDRDLERLSAVPAAEQCGWLKDRYGVSWQVVPAELEPMMQQADPEQLARLTQAFLGMTKLDLAALRSRVRFDT